MATERAATAPVELAGPSARTHLPTARSVGAAGSVSEKLVDDVVSTVTVRWAPVLGLVSVTVNDVAVVAVTWPVAKRPKPVARRRWSAGSEPVVGVPVRCPVRKPPRPAAALRSHVPEDVASTRTVVATSGVGPAVDEEDGGDEVGEEGLPAGSAATALTHAPTTTADELAGTVWVKAVAVV
jgi:hypothetical protein